MSNLDITFWYNKNNKNYGSDNYKIIKKISEIDELVKFMYTIHNKDNGLNVNDYELVATFRGNNPIWKKNIGICSLRIGIDLAYDLFEYFLYIMIAKDSPLNLSDRNRINGVIFSGIHGKFGIIRIWFNDSSSTINLPMEMMNKFKGLSVVFKTY
jgi:hypothetical protein